MPKPPLSKGLVWNAQQCASGVRRLKGGEGEGFENDCCRLGRWLRWFQVRREQNGWWAIGRGQKRFGRDARFRFFLGFDPLRTLTCLSKRTGPGNGGMGPHGGRTGQPPPAGAVRGAPHLLPASGNRIHEGSCSHTPPPLSLELLPNNRQHPPQPTPVRAMRG